MRNKIFLLSAVTKGIAQILLAIVPPAHNVADQVQNSTFPAAEPRSNQHIAHSLTNKLHQQITDPNSGASTLAGFPGT